MTKYINDISARYGSSDKYVIASKYGITVTFDLELNVEYDGVHYIDPEIEFNGAIVTESGVSILSFGGSWLYDFTEEVLTELKQNESYKGYAEEFLLKWLDDENC